MSPTADNAMRSQSRTPDDAPERDATTNTTAIVDNSSVPKPKRLACMICRKRKLKCDGSRPSCATCARLGHDCTYDEIRRKSGPKRGYVKALEERLKQVETLLQSQDSNSTMPIPTSTKSNAPNTAPDPLLQMATGNPSMTAADIDMDSWQMDMDTNEAPQITKDFNFNASMPISMNDSDFTWEMIGLGLEEPLPPQETIDELHQIYFEKCHPSMPMIHKYRYLAAMNLAPAARPPVCLRYAMWTMACVLTDKFVNMKDLFYQRARKYLEADYMKGFGEHMISVAHCQTHILLAGYEMRSMYFPRAWVNTGSAVRLAQMIGLHRLDGPALDVKQCLPEAKDWTEKEERRRTFWMSFCQDRYASIGTGWPMIIDEKDIATNLPASDEAFDLSRSEKTGTLSAALGISGASSITSFGGIVLMAALFGQNLLHLHRPDGEDSDANPNGPFWKRHRQMDNVLLNTSLCLPAHLKLPGGIANSNVVFTNMCIHTSAICLHQAAIFKVDKAKMAASLAADSKVRCITAANEIASIMRNISHMDLSTMNPFISFCLYVAARVFIQYLKSRPEDGPTADSLKFLLSAMNALKRRNPLTESFLVQLDIDFEALVARNPKLRDVIPRPGDSPGGLKIRSQVAPAGAVCDDPDGVKGILSYKNECNFLKVVGDHGGLHEAPRLDETTEDQSSASNFAESYPHGSWLGVQQNNGQTLTPRTGSTTGEPTFGYGGSVDARDASARASPDAEGTGGRTPSSISANSNARPFLSTGPTGQPTTERSYSDGQFEKNTMMGNTTGSNTNNFFGTNSMGNDFLMQTNLDTHQNGGFSMDTGWPATAGQGQQGMGEIADGMLTALMNMGPVEGMDMPAGWTDVNNQERR